MELFSPKEDLVFKMLFGDARHIDLLTAFLQAVLPLDKDEYEEVSLLPPTSPTEYPLDKLSILDVKVKTKHGIPDRRRDPGGEPDRLAAASVAWTRSLDKRSAGNVESTDCASLVQATLAASWRWVDSGNNNRNLNANSGLDSLLRNLLNGAYANIMTPDCGCEAR
jgi:hypothetical protein